MRTTRKVRRAAFARWFKQQKKAGVLSKARDEGFAEGERQGAIMGEIVTRNRLTTAAFGLTYEEEPCTPSE